MVLPSEMSKNVRGADSLTFNCQLLTVNSFFRGFINMQYYFAPMEGLTDSIYRRLHHKYFPGVDR